MGWTELIRPLTHNDLWPLAPAATTVVGLAALAVRLAGRRDVGDGVLASADVASVRPFGLGSPFGLAVRLEVPVLAAWCAGAMATGALLGVLAKLTTSTSALPESMQEMLEKYRGEGSFADRYLSLAFLFVAMVVALLPAGQIGGMCADETSGRLVHVLSRPVRRREWFVGRLLLTATAMTTSGVLAGAGTWLGAKSQGVDLDLAPLLGAGLNVVPIGIVVLGAGSVMLSVAPRAAASTVYGVVIWSVLVDVAVPLLTDLTWLGRLSLFHYMALLPAEDLDPTTVVGTIAVGLALCALATVVVGRRDIRTA